MDEKIQREIQDFVYSGEYVIHTRNDMDFIPKNVMKKNYNEFTASKNNLPLSVKEFPIKFNSVFKSRVKPALSATSLDGFLGFAPAHSDRFEKAVEGVKAWLSTPIKAKEKDWFRADYNSLIRLYNVFALQHGFPTFQEYVLVSYNEGCLYDSEYWHFGKALDKLGLYCPVPDREGEEIQIVNKAGITLAEVVLR